MFESSGFIYKIDLPILPKNDVKVTGTLWFITIHGLPGKLNNCNIRQTGGEQHTNNLVHRHHQLTTVDDVKVLSRAVKYINMLFSHKYTAYVFSDEKELLKNVSKLPI